MNSNLLCNVNHAEQANSFNFNYTYQATKRSDQISWTSGAYLKPQYVS